MMLSFSGAPLAVIKRNNQIWLSSKDIATALGYAKTNAITHIYNTNTDEFSPGMTEIVESNTSGNLKSRTRIFSLRGAHLIAMFARTPVAKDFRRWVLDILEREVGEPVATTSPTKSVQIAPPGEYQLLLSMKGTQVVDTELVAPGKMLIFIADMPELMMRAGYVVMPFAEVGKVTMDEWRELADRTRRISEQWCKNSPKLAVNADFLRNT